MPSFSDGLAEAESRLGYNRALAFGLYSASPVLRLPGGTGFQPVMMGFAPAGSRCHPKERLHGDSDPNIIMSALRMNLQVAGSSSPRRRSPHLGDDPSPRHRSPSRSSTPLILGGPPMRRWYPPLSTSRRAADFPAVNGMRLGARRHIGKHGRKNWDWPRKDT